MILAHSISRQACASALIMASRCLATAIEPAPLQLQSGAIILVEGLSAPLSTAPVGQEFSREPLQPCDHPAVFDV